MSRPSPLSISQAQLWFLHRLDPRSPTYNVPWRLRLRGPLDIGALRGAVAAIVDRHDCLRARFADGADGPVQVLRDPPPPLGVTDLRAARTGERWSLAEQLSERDARAPFDLEVGPLVRATLVRLADDDHVLMMTVHHIVADGWSFGVLGDDLAAAYDAFAAGREPAFEPLPARYEDFVREQRELLAGEAGKELLEHWVAVLADAPTVELPADRPRPARLSGRGRQLTKRLPARLVGDVRACAAAHRATPFVLLMTAFKALLARYTRSVDLVVGTAFLNRTRPDLERVVGFFANMLPIRTQLDGDPSFAGALAAVRDSTLTALMHQELPFGTLVEALSPRRDLSRNPILQVALSYNGGQPEAPALADLEVERLEVDTGAARLDLNLEFTESGDGLVAVAEYSADLYDAETIARLLRQLETLLRDAVAHPDRRLSELQLMDEDEERALVAAATALDAGPAAEPSITARFEAQAARRREAPALVMDGALVSYGELDASANRLAQHLRAEGAQEGDLVAICLDRTAAIPVAILGVLKAGCAYLPLDPSNPAERLAFMLQDAAPAALVSDRERVATLGRPYPRTVLLDADAARIAVRPATAPERSDHPERLAYVIYTSGSTGKPKGVRIVHGNVTRLFTATERWFGFGPSDVWPLFHSYAFDWSVFELWGALAHGGRLVIVPYATSRSPRDFRELVVREDVTVLNQTPTAFAGFLRAELKAERKASTLRYVITAGEALDVALVEPWFREHGDQCPTFVNMYGITETTVHASYRPIRWDDIHRGRSPIGEPIPDLAFHLVDEHLRPVPVGVPGELLVAGAGVGRGYLNRPELTAQRFIDDPFAPGRPAYRSGDLARRGSDGELEYLGRIDDQVKIRGFRVELGEVRAALLAHPRIDDAVAVVHRDEGEPMLVAYCVADGELVDRRELHRFLRDTLPAHEIPARFVPIDAVPMTVNGKVDRRRLPAPAPEPAGEFDTAELPRTNTERRIAAAMREILGVGQVGVGDNFFEIGGHSLAATRLLAEIAASLDSDVPLVDFLRDPSVGSLARHVDARRTQADPAARISPVVTLAEGDPAAAALYFVHPVGGSVLCYRRLVDALAGGFTVRAFQLPDADDRDPSLPELASRYVAEMNGSDDVPVALGGWSLGGLIALEMAQQLRAQGRPVAFVAALDAPPPGMLRPIADAGELALAFGKDVAAMLGRTLRADGLSDADVPQVLAAIHRAVPEVGIADLERRWRVFQWLYRAGASLPVGRYAENVRLFTAAGDGQAAAAWAALVDARFVHESVDADHYSIITAPAADAIAASLARALERTTAERALQRTAAERCGTMTRP